MKRSTEATHMDAAPLLRKSKRWLFIGPHPDDVELGCGGTIAKFSNSIDIHYLVVSPALEDPRNRNILKELYEAAKVLGIKEENIRVLNFPRRVLHNLRNELRAVVVEVVEEVDPDTIFTTPPNDLHQDHAVLGEEVLRLFRSHNVVGYEVIRSALNFIPNMYVKLEEEHIRRKIEALQKYESQRDRFYFKPDVIEALARMRGAQAEAKYAEAFRVYRLIIE